MSLNIQVIQLSEVDEILQFESDKLKEHFPDEMKRSIQSWNARWRKESLEHYISLGWSFRARNDEGVLSGYFLAQPLLFFDGQTQSLWVEYIQHASLQARDALCELAYKLSREKHFQRVYFPNQSGVTPAVAAFKPEEWEPQIKMIKTTKA